MDIKHIRKGLKIPKGLRIGQWLINHLNIWFPEHEEVDKLYFMSDEDFIKLIKKHGKP